MKVKELKAAIADLPDDMQVILPRHHQTIDGYSVLNDIDSNAVYIAESEYCGEAYRSSWSADDVSIDEDDWQEILKKPRFLLLGTL